MKIPSAILVLLVAFALPAAARITFPLYESLSPEEKKAWGYTVDKFVGHNWHNAWLHLTIPPKAAKLYEGASLGFKDRQGKLLATVQADMIRAEDGSLSISVELFEGFGSAELVICTKMLPEAPFHGSVGGFTFEVPTEP